MKRVLSLILALVTLTTVLSLSSCGLSEKIIEKEMHEFCYEYYVENGKIPEKDFEKYFYTEYGGKIGGDKNGYETEYEMHFGYGGVNNLCVAKFKKISDAKKWQERIESNTQVRYYLVRKGAYVIAGYDEAAVKGLAERIF